MAAPFNNDTSLDARLAIRNLPPSPDLADFSTFSLYHNLQAQQAPPAPQPKQIQQVQESSIKRGFSLKRVLSSSKQARPGLPPIPSSPPAYPPSQSARRDSQPEDHGASALQRSKSRKMKIIDAIANPEVIFARDPLSPPPESKFNISPTSKLARTFFGGNSQGQCVDFGSGVPGAPPTPTTSIPGLEEPLFSEELVSARMEADLPPGYEMRPLTRGDFGRGYLDVLGTAGRVDAITDEAWEERCEWLRSMASTYFIVVILGPASSVSARKAGKSAAALSPTSAEPAAGEKRVVATGTVFLERKFLSNMGTVAHVEDIAVSRAVGGMKMGMRILEALLYAAKRRGAHKTIVNCAVENEGFHAQSGFEKEGSQMVLYMARRKGL